MSTQPTITYLCNGQLQQTCALNDRGLHYGDGVFETVAVLNGKLQYLSYHLERLYVGCQRLGIVFDDHTQLTQEVLSLSQDQARAVLKIIITRGSSGRGYAPVLDAVPTRIVALYDWPQQPQQYYAQGIHVRICSLRLAQQSVLAQIKHLNRLEQVLARSEWNDPTIQEGLLMDHQDHVICGTKTNLFIVKNDKLFTARLDQCGIAGVMRRMIMKLSPDCQEQDLDLVQLFSADEVFVCNSIIGIWPIVKIDTHDFAIGPRTRHLMTQLGVSAYATD